MNFQDIAHRLDTCRLHALGARRRVPLIGVTGNYDDDKLTLLPGYFRSLEDVGAAVVVIPPSRLIPDAIVPLIERLDGLLLSGGADLNPRLMGEEPCQGLGSINAERDAFEVALTQLAYDRGVPTLGICRGIQVMAAALGGKVIQDLASDAGRQHLLKHSQQAARGVATHSVHAVEESIVASCLGTQFDVNSFHHQAVGEVGSHFRPTAWAADGVVEAIECTEHKWMVGVQWHPECFLLERDACMRPLFEAFVQEAARFADAKRVHQQVLTLDSHCDTPMLFSPTLDLTRREESTCVDFQKMREGGLDASIMVAYIPQGELDDAHTAAATQEAERLLKELKQRVTSAPGVALARTPDMLYQHKDEGLLSVMLGIENGYAIGSDLSLLKHFRDMGIVYMTLCHNGDNAICDSARRSQQTHGGLSDWGREVVQEMNRLGLMVDLSHAAESSFYDALELSATPIVCSHASCKALCNHPRNLTDDQLQALADRGGVAQVTLYHGFLRDEAEGIEATAHDAVAHLLHMIDVAGIDHVGIGTDFDGDGGIKGLRTASDLHHFTQLLRAEGLSVNDLRKIWGGNFLRVMQICQDERSA